MNQQVDPITRFVDDMLSQKKLSPSLPASALEEIRTDLLERVNKAINVALLASLPVKDADKCVELLESGKQEEAMDLIEKKSKNTGEIVTKALVNFRIEYMKEVR